jgi:hypothetical protein
VPFVTPRDGSAIARTYLSYCPAAYREKRASN